MGEFAPSKYQQAIFDFVETGTGSALVEAVAGSGKTTTIVEALKLLHPDEDVVFLAFNKSIATELAARVPDNTQASTFHSLCMRSLMKALPGRPEVDDKKTDRILKAEFNPISVSVYGQVVKKLVGYAKAHGLVPSHLTENQVPYPVERTSTDRWFEIVDHYGVDFQDEDTDASWERAFEMANHVLEIGLLHAHVIDFDDMLFMTVVLGAPMQRFDWVFVDEAQDVSPIQIAVLRKVLRPDGGRLVAVGDPCQAIYGFRGADSNALENLSAEFGCQRLPLSISYRCSRAIVEEAQEVVSHIESHPKARAGSVEHPLAWTAQDVKPGDAILCRVTAPLLEQAFRLITGGVGCQVLGRDIGKGLVRLVEKQKAKGIDRLLEKLDKWSSREREKALQKGQDARAQTIDDQVDCIRACIDALPETERTVPALLRSIDGLFNPPSSAGPLVTLATVHKSKGLEWDRVFILDRGDHRPSKWARKEWQQVQENNLIYVAITRAKEDLVYISAENFAQEVK
jgi:superfamily I DNA/RNA helicase